MISPGRAFFDLENGQVAYLLMIGDLNKFSSFLCPSLSTWNLSCAGKFFDDHFIHSCLPLNHSFSFFLLRLRSALCFFQVILNRGNVIERLLQRGHLLGVLNLLRFLKMNPQSRQQAGSITKRFGRADLEICRRWSKTSLSLIWKIFESSRISRESFSRASAISLLSVGMVNSRRFLSRHKIV